MGRVGGVRCICSGVVVVKVLVLYGDENMKIEHYLEETEW